MLGCHKLPIATGHRAGVVRASRLCTMCSSGALGDERHLAFECASLAVPRAKYADLLTATANAMRSFLAQRGHLRVLRVFHYVIRLHEYDERIVIATRRRMRADLLAG